MLDPWIIEEIKRRERQKDERPSVIELPIHPIQGPDGRDRQRPDKNDDPPRGIAIIDYGIACW
jgi:hypothetical protein